MFLGRGGGRKCPRPLAAVAELGAPLLCMGVDDMAVVAAFEALLVIVLSSGRLGVAKSSRGPCFSESSLMVSGFLAPLGVLARADLYMS